MIVLLSLLFLRDFVCQCAFFLGSWALRSKGEERERNEPFHVRRRLGSHPKSQSHTTEHKSLSRLLPSSSDTLTNDYDSFAQSDHMQMSLNGLALDLFRNSIDNFNA